MLFLTVTMPDTSSVRTALSRPAKCPGRGPTTNRGQRVAEAFSHGLLQLAGLRLSDGGDRAPGLTGSDGVTADRRGLEQWKLSRQDVVAINP